MQALRKFQPCSPARSDEEIGTAIRLCAEQCLDDINPQEYIQAFGDKLSTKGWNDMNIRQVQNGVLHVINYLRNEKSLFPKKDEEPVS